MLVLRGCAIAQPRKQHPREVFSPTIPTFRESRKHDRRGSVEERSYRQSRLCRLFGNPVAFAIVELLAEHREMSPSQIAQAVGRSLSRVSHTLAALRLAEVVRYDSDRKMRARYRLKHPREIRRVLTALSDFINAASPSK
ncbi:MAG: winged helix-turn-helix transcriptional regulator [Deltaproteobacteria bacterium]|nr:winged helix-turn-helix transcriptional regulator [Deltaproteobacteria bacterium]